MFSISGARFRDAKHVELDVVVGGRPVVWFEETRPEKRVVLSVSADYHLVIIHPRTSVARRRRLRTPHNGATLRIILSLFLSAVFFRCRRVNSSWRRRRRRRFFAAFVSLHTMLSVPCTRSWREEDWGSRSGHVLQLGSGLLAERRRFAVHPDFKTIRTVDRKPKQD